MFFGKRSLQKKQLCWQNLPICGITLFFKPCKRGRYKYSTRCRIIGKKAVYCILYSTVYILQFLGAGGITQPTAIQLLYAYIKLHGCGYIKQHGYGCIKFVCQSYIKLHGYGYIKLHGYGNIKLVGYGNTKLVGYDMAIPSWLAMAIQSWLAMAIPSWLAMAIPSWMVTAMPS